MLHPHLSEGTITVSVSENRINKSFALALTFKNKHLWKVNIFLNQKALGR